MTSNNWKDYNPAPLEFFHDALQTAFHDFRKSKSDNLSVSLNGMEFNKIVVKAKKLTHLKYMSMDLVSPILKSKNMSEIEKELKPYSEHMNNIMKTVQDDLQGQTDKMFTEALRRKGLVFDDRSELIAFVESWCTCENDTTNQVRTYFAQGVPILAHHYKLQIEAVAMTDDHSTSILAICGGFKFL